MKQAIGIFLGMVLTLQLAGQTVLHRRKYITGIG